MFWRTLLLSLVLCFLSTTAFAQQGTADLRGRIVDEQEAALPGVTIVARHQGSGLYRETVSGADGSFLFSAMPPGIYEVVAELAGFRKHSQRDVRLEVGRTAQLTIELVVGGLTEEVTVSAGAPLVDSSSNESAVWSVRRHSSTRRSSVAISPVISACSLASWPACR
jgi:hypothetical protein